MAAGHRLWKAPRQIPSGVLGAMVIIHQPCAQHGSCTLLRYHLNDYLIHFRHIVTSLFFLVSNNKELGNKCQTPLSHNLFLHI